MKCLPSTKPELLASGHVLHDWHAEIVAIRAFNHFLLQECKMLVQDEAFQSSVLTRNDHDNAHGGSKHPFSIRTSIKIFMYCSEAPCGDASMELVMEAQEDATPWRIAPSSDAGLLGRGSFSQLGVVRRKPCGSNIPMILSSM